MSGFSRLGEFDYSRLGGCNRWTVAETANIIIDAQKSIDGSFNAQNWENDCQELFVKCLSNVFVFWRSKKDLKVYDPDGDFAEPLTACPEVFSQCGFEEWGIDATLIFMKKDVLGILRKANPSVFNFGSSAESVEIIRFRQLAKCMI